MDFKTADLCDDFSDELQIVIGHFNNYGGHHSFHGEISTLKLYENNQLVRSQLETPGNGRVLVVDGGGSNRCALLGDMLAELAISNHWSGVLVYGCIRDSEDIGKMPIGVKALGVMPLKSVKRDEGQIDIPITFCNATFSPGDYIYSDADGIIVAKRNLLS